MSMFDDSYEGFDDEQVRDLRAIMTSAADQALAGAMTIDNLKRMTAVVTVVSELLRGLEAAGMTTADAAAAVGGLIAQIIHKNARGELDELKEMLGDE